MEEDIVKCPNCRGEEYWGEIRWRDGHQYCRKCIYEIWIKDTNGKWQHSEQDKIFPERS